ncbi:hypothetical protein SAMN05877753_10216 [Bacillus oleivorans]|uniref:Uncharacterized protein n=1 Tax=Bacillus oleivorans TaxID=1448271 RepID=A0A285CJP5_9BACI|nr:hypothetical protein [Bacillus oleivorans]SNX67812.1 hypothetical protein SAMN05877753_10216 [Bacillus oleivorans]
MIQLGRKIYYDKSSGNVVWEIGERTYQFDTTETTIDQDIATFTALSERNRESFDVMKFEFGQFAQDFAECNGYRVDPATKTLEFSYPDPNAPQEPQPYQAPLTEQIKAIKEQQVRIDTDLASFMDYVISTQSGGM